MTKYTLSWEASSLLSPHACFALVFSFTSPSISEPPAGWGREWGLTYMASMGMCRWKGYGFWPLCPKQGTKFLCVCTQQGVYFVICPIHGPKMNGPNFTFVAPEEGLFCKPKYRTIFCIIHFFCFTYFVFCVFVSLTAVRISRSVYFFT